MPFASGHRAEAMTVRLLSADLAAAKVAWFAIRRAVQGPGRSFPSAGYHLGKIKGLSGSVHWLCLLSLPPPAPAPTGLAPLCPREAGCLLPGWTSNHRCSLRCLLVLSWKNFPQLPLSPPHRSRTPYLFLLSYVTVCDYAFICVVVSHCSPQ